MSVMICGENRTKLRVMGDIEAELSVPADAVGHCWLSFSDGTLVEAAFDDSDAYRFAISQEGAAIACIQHDGARDILRLDWRMEWVMVAAATNAARAAPQEPLPLIPGLLG